MTSAGRSLPMTFAGSVALVTGAASGIGAATARRLRRARRRAALAAQFLEAEFVVLGRTAQLLLELLIAVLQLLDLPGHLANLVLQHVEPHHEIGAGHLRRRGHRPRQQK